MATGPEGDHFDVRWIGLALRALLTDASHTGPPAEVEVHVEDQVLTVAVGPDGREVRPGPAAAPAATIGGDALQLLAVGSGQVPLGEADHLTVTGDRAVARSVLGDVR